MPRYTPRQIVDVESTHQITVTHATRATPLSRAQLSAVTMMLSGTRSGLQFTHTADRKILYRNDLIVPDMMRRWTRAVLKETIENDSAIIVLDDQLPRLTAAESNLVATDLARLLNFHVNISAHAGITILHHPSVTITGVNHVDVQRRSRERREMYGYAVLTGNPLRRSA